MENNKMYFERAVARFEKRSSGRIGSPRSKFELDAVTAVIGIMMALAITHGLRVW